MKNEKYSINKQKYIIRTSAQDYLTNHEKSTKEESGKKVIFCESGGGCSA